MFEIDEKASPPPAPGARSPAPSKPREDWPAHVVPQNWDAFSAEDHAVWDLLFSRQVELLGSRVVAPFLDGIDLLRLAHPGVPDVDGLNAILTPRTGWRVVAVPGLVPDAAFFAMLSQRVFPVGNFIRRRAQLDYLEAPDCFHDMFGHIPMLAHHEFAEMVEHVGRLGTVAIAVGEGERVARLYWHSVEFGLAMDGGALKILGAGLASSFGEAHFSLEDEAVERLPFSVDKAVKTAYRHDAFQPRYLVSASLDETIAAVLALGVDRLLAIE
jgi:phenylalanine-4-hydroxylase